MKSQYIKRVLNILLYWGVFFVLSWLVPVIRYKEYVPFFQSLYGVIIAMPILPLKGVVDLFVLFVPIKIGWYLLFWMIFLVIHGVYIYKQNRYTTALLLIFLGLTSINLVTTFWALMGI